MAGAILHTDLFSFPEYEKAIEDARKQTQGFASTVGSVIKELQRRQQEYNGELQKYIKLLNSYNAGNFNAQKTLSQYNDIVSEAVKRYHQLNDATTGLTTVNNAATASQRALAAELKQLKKDYENLDKSNKDYEQELERINSRLKNVVPQVRTFTDVLRQSKKSLDAASGTYNKWAQDLTNLKNKLQSLPNAFNATTGAINKQNKEAVALQAQIGKLDQTLKRADSAMGLYGRNVGSYASAIKQAGRSLLNTIGLVIGINSAFQGITAILNINKQLDSLSQKLKLVSNSEAELAKNQVFLTKAADAYGISISDITENFVKFYSASTNAGFSAESTRKIFDQFAKAFGNLRLTQEQTNSAFIALDQIMSKGKLSAEEIRKQLGNVLPGAFELAAKSIGVTTSELDKMLKSGKVLSTDFLPKFAKQLEETFGKRDRVEGLQASINRLQNSMKTLVQSQEVTSFFTEVTSLVGSMISGLNEFISLPVEDKLRHEQAELNALVGVLLNTNTSQQTRNALIKILQEKYPDFLKNLRAEVLTTDQLNDRLRIVNGLYNERIKLATRARITEKIKKEQDESLDAFAGAGVAFQKGANALGVNTAQFDLNTKKGVQDLAAILQKNLETLRKTNKKKASEIAEGIEEDLANALGGNFALSKKFFFKLGALDFGDVAKIALENLGSLTKSNRELSVAEAAEAEQKAKSIEATKEKIKVEEAQLTVLEKQRKTIEANMAAGRRVGRGALRNINNSIAIKQSNIVDLKTSIGDTPDNLHVSPVDHSKADADARKAVNRERKRISDIQEDLKKAALEEIEINKGKLANHLIDEFTFQKEKLRIIREFAAKATVLENSLKKPDAGRLSEFNTERLKAEREFTEYFQRQQEERGKFAKKAHEEGIKAYYERIKKEEDLEAELSEKVYRLQEEKLQRKIELLDREYALEEAKRGANFKRHLEYLNKRLEAEKRAGKDTQEAQGEIDLLQADRQRELADRETQFATDLANTLLEIAQQSAAAKYEAHISSLEKERDRELDLAGNNTAAKEKINKDFDKRIAAEKTKAAKAEKQAALFSIAIDTAAGVAKDLKTWGMPFALPFIALTLGTGILQAALVASRPIPKFEKGTRAAPKGPAIVAEKGYELIERNGRMYVAREPQITKMEGGETVWTHEQSKKIIEQAFTANNEKPENVSVSMLRTINKGKEEQSIAMLAKAIQVGGITELQMERAMSNALSKLPIEKNIWDERGYRRSQQTKNGLTTYLNEKHKY